MKLKKILIIILIFSCAASCKKEKQDLCEGTPLPQLGTCTAVTPHGNLSYDDSTGAYTYKTKGGGIVIFNIGPLQIRHENYPNFKYELWGGYMENGQTKLSYLYENLNGKQIKNKIGHNRTILFPDGAKVTLAALSDTLQVLTISIYDGADSYRFNTTCNRTLEHSLADRCTTQALDNAEADGETSSFEITSTGLIFFNLYFENTPGNKVYNRYNLGELELGNNNLVRDWYDDPRVGHT